MGDLKMITGLIIIIGAFGITGTIMAFAYKAYKNWVTTKRLKLEKEILELKKEEDERKIKLLEDENQWLKRYTNIEELKQSNGN
jgi:hypothetical protein